MDRTKALARKIRFNEYVANLGNYGKWIDQYGDKVCAFLFAICPILQHYNGLYKNAGFTVYLILLPWMVIRLLLTVQRNKVQIKQMATLPLKQKLMFLLNEVPTLPLMLFFAYSAVIHDINVSKILHNGFLIFMCVLFEIGGFNGSHGFKHSYFSGRHVLKFATGISVVATIVLVVQYICFYIFGFHLCVVPTGALLPESSSWIAGAQTGLINIRGGTNGFYRPSAFFLEPSHLFIYFFPVLCMLVFSKNMTKFRFRIALLISLGILLSTSGMGMVCCFCVWLCYVLFYCDKTKINIAKLKKCFSLRSVFNLRNILIASGVVAVTLILYFTVDPLANAINRILFDSSVFSGRFGQASTLVQGLSGSSLLFGLTDNASNIKYNLPGFFATLYKRGLLGILLSYWFYVRGLFKLKDAGFWMSVIILILSVFSAHTHGTFYMMYFVSFLMAEYKK